MNEVYTEEAVVEVVFNEANEPVGEMLVTTVKKNGIVIKQRSEPIGNWLDQILKA
jgi:hypothetical protein